MPMYLTPNGKEVRVIPMNKTYRFHEITDYTARLVVLHAQDMNCYRKCATEWAYFDGRQRRFYNGSDYVATIDNSGNVLFDAVQGCKVSEPLSVIVEVMEGSNQEGVTRSTNTESRFPFEPEHMGR